MSYVDGCVPLLVWQQILFLLGVGFGYYVFSKFPEQGSLFPRPSRTSLCHG